MKKILFAVLLIGCINGTLAQQKLTAFNLSLSNFTFDNKYDIVFDEQSKLNAEKYYSEMKEKITNRYRFWKGVNSSEHLFHDHDPSSRDALAYRGTDYFEVHFAAKRFMDSTYKVNLIEEGKEAFKEQLVAKDKEYLKVLNKLRSMIDQQDFYLMLAYAKKLDRKILFVQINQEDEKGNFYLLIGDPKGFDMTDWTRSTYKILSSDEIPTNYVIQDKFDQF